MPTIKITLLFIICYILSSCTQAHEKSGLNSLNFNTDNYINRTQQKTTAGRSEFSRLGADKKLLSIKFYVDKPSNKDNSTQILARVTPVLPMKETLNFSWKMVDPSLEVLKGATAGEVSVDNNKKHYDFVLVVRNFHSEKLKHIRFEVRGKTSAQLAFAEGIISNQKHNSFEEIVREVETFNAEK